MRKHLLYARNGIRDLESILFQNLAVHITCLSQTLTNRQLPSQLSNLVKRQVHESFVFCAEYSAYIYVPTSYLIICKTRLVCVRRTLCFIFRENWWYLHAVVGTRIHLETIELIALVGTSCKFIGSSDVILSVCVKMQEPLHFYSIE